MEFKSFGKKVDVLAIDEEDGKLFEADMSSEFVNRGVAMSSVGNQKTTPSTIALPQVVAPAIDMPGPLDAQDKIPLSAEEKNISVEVAPAVVSDAVENSTNNAQSTEPMIAALMPEIVHSANALLGIVLEHGAANFEFDKKNNMNYFVRYMDVNGVEKMQWGIDLKRALKDTGIVVGDSVSMENMGKKPVEVFAPLLDAEGKIILTADGKISGYEKKVVDRVYWAVSKIASLTVVAKSDALKKESVESDASDLVKSVKEGVAAQAKRSAHENDSVDSGAPKRRSSDSGIVPVSSGVVAAQTVGHAVGGVIAGVLSVPYIALTSAQKLLKQKFGSKPESVLASEQSKGSVPAMSLLNSMEKITEWKCERIEKMEMQLRTTMSNIKNLEGFPVWEDMVNDRAIRFSVTPSEIVKKMSVDPECLDLKGKMDDIWKQNPEKINAFREAYGDFERNVRNVVKEFPNSEDAIKSRVTKSMSDVMMEGLIMPGFGEKVGEYGATVEERVRMLAKQISDFVQSMLEKLTGRSQSKSPAMES